MSSTDSSVTSKVAATTKKAAMGVGFLVGGAVAVTALTATTITGVGPAVQYVKSRSDRALLDATLAKCLESGEFSFTSTSAGNELFTRFRDRRSHPGAMPIPIVIPNGLAATLMTTARMHEALEAAGFTVLSFDRPGVGYSKRAATRNASAVEPLTVDDCVREMREVMLAHIPDERQKWIILGPSMGATVGECYVAAHPDTVAGFVSVDGMPHNFDVHRDKFLTSSGIYNLVSKLAWTGALRVPMSIMARTMLPNVESKYFSVAVIQADMNRGSFWANTRLEFTTMMDLAASASAAWGAVSASKLPADVVAALAARHPTQYGDLLPDGTWTPLPLAPSDLDVCDAATMQKAMDQLAQSATQSALAQKWKAIAVAVMSARSFEYPGGDWLTPDMRRGYAAEHTLLMTLGKPGSVRYAFPALGHDKLFLRADAVVVCATDVHKLASA